MHEKDSMQIDFEQQFFGFFFKMSKFLNDDLPH